MVRSDGECQDDLADTWGLWTDGLMDDESLQLCSL